MVMLACVAVYPIHINGIDIMASTLVESRMSGTCTFVDELCNHGPERLRYVGMCH